MGAGWWCKRQCRLRCSGSCRPGRGAGTPNSGRRRASHRCSGRRCRRVGAIALFSERRRKLRGSAGLVSEQESQRKPMTREVIGEQTPAEPDALWMFHGGTLLFFNSTVIVAWRGGGCQAGKRKKKRKSGFWDCQAGICKNILTTICCCIKMRVTNNT